MNNLEVTCIDCGKNKTKSDYQLCEECFFRRVGITFKKKKTVINAEEKKEVISTAKKKKKK